MNKYKVIQYATVQVDAIIIEVQTGDHSHTHMIIQLPILELMEIS
jgi:hypothetical protein